MKRIKTIVFVFVPICIEIARTRVPKPAVVVSSQDREILAFVMRTIFQSISHSLRGRLNQKQGEK